VNDAVNALDRHEVVALLQLLQRIPQLRESTRRKDHPFGGCRQGPTMDTATLNPKETMGRGGISMLSSWCRV